MVTEPPDTEHQTMEVAIPAPTLRIRADGGHVWEIPDEEPGTLAEIFAAEDTRAQNLVLYEVRKGDGFRKSWEAIGAPGDPYDLILALTTCIGLHLNPRDRLADHCRRMRLTAENASAATTAQEFSSSLEQIERLAWMWRLKDLGLSYPDDPRIIPDLRSMAAGLNGMLARGALKDRGGRLRMAAFERLIQDLAHIFKRATGRQATITRDHHRAGGYGGRFWRFVEIVRPIAATVIETFGAGSLAQPATEPARGKFIEEVLKKARTGKTRDAAG